MVNTGRQDRSEALGDVVVKQLAGAVADVSGPKGPDGLTDRQRAFVEAVAKGDDLQEACRAAGYAESVHYSVVIQSESVGIALQAACSAAMKGPMRVKALRAMEDLLKDSTPSATRFNAAKFVLEYGEDDSQDGDKPLSEMTEAELLAVVEKARKAADPDRMKVVTPKNGA